MRKSDRLIVVRLLAACVLLLSQPTWGWIESGHTIVALVAWEDLTPKARQAVTEVLKAHPRYDKDLLVDAPEGATAEQMDRHVFARSAIWPDLVKLDDNPMRFGYSHPSWHYIDDPYVVGDLPVPKERPTTQPGPHNILEALAKNVADLKDPSNKPADRAIAMCWITHLVGDVHQPLHACMMVSAQYPEGDQGGNAQNVMRDPPYRDSVKKLHLVWDELPGQFKSEELDEFEAMGVRADPRYSREKLKDDLAVTDFAGWEKESHALAVKYAYLDGTLKSATTQAVRADPRLRVPGLPPGYVRRAEHIAIQRVVLAGYRLADLLNATFDPK